MQIFSAFFSWNCRLENDLYRAGSDADQSIYAKSRLLYTNFIAKLFFFLCFASFSTCLFGLTRTEKKIERKKHKQRKPVFTLLTDRRLHEQHNFWIFYHIQLIQFNLKVSIFN